MELSPVSASLGAMSSLPRKLGALLATGNWAMRGIVMDEIQQLTADVGILYNFMLKLLDAPQDPPKIARYWMKDVRELSYDMDDFADQFVHAHGRAKIHLAAFRKKKKFSRLKIGRLPDRRKWRPWITHKISEFRTRAQEATRRYRNYKFDSNPGYSSSGRELPTILQDPADLVGIEGPMNELERWLISGEEQLKVVSIVGVGGIGKTTLALQLWGKLRGQFECGAFVRTAQKPDMRGILRNLLLQLRPHQPPNHGEMGHLINDLREYLQDKRYFVIIDDLWSTSVWDVISRAFPKGDSCSRIMTTTKIMEVALACSSFCPEHIFRIEHLSDNDSKKLLLQRILVSVKQSPQQVDDVIPQIIRSCGGLPLAIIIVARILASQPEKLEQWGSADNSFDSILGAKPTIEGFMGQILNICFITLPHYLKTCLLYLSTYPEGYLFLKDDLVKQWVAEGFICANQGEDMEEVAGSYFDELVSMGLIQVMDINCDFESLSYSVHQLLLDLITYKSMEGNFIAVVDYSQTTIPLTDKVRRLSLHFGSATYATTEASTGLSQVRSLFFSGLFNCMPSFMLFKLLQVLILHYWDDTGTKTLNLTEICELFRLRYLQVTCNVAVKLPNKIEAMKHLETLEINARVLDIPPDIIRLPSLLHLHLRGANLPSGIGCIRSLRTLMYFDLGNSSEDNLWGLGELTNLRDLHLTYSSSLSSEHLKRNLIALASSLGKLCNLKSLTLTPDTAGIAILFDGLSDMSTPISLERLELLPPICIFSRLPKWTGQLHKICIMKVAVRELMLKDIAILRGLPFLTILSLSVQTALEERIIFDDMAFPVLKCFKFRCGVLCMTFMAGAMPNLRRLKLGFNTHIGEKCDNMLVGIEHLLNLQDIAGQIGASMESDWRAAESAMNDAINKHPRFPRRKLQWVDPIEEDCRPSEEHQWSQEKNTLGEKHGVLEKANDLNKLIDSRWSQLLNLPSTVASGRRKSGIVEVLEESNELPAPSLARKVSSLRRRVDLVEEECHHPLEKHHLTQEKGSVGETHVGLERAKDINKHADSGLSQLPKRPSTVASGHLNSGLVENSKESTSSLFPRKFPGAAMSAIVEQFSQPVCQYYMKTGTCKFGSNCKYHHPKDMHDRSEQPVMLNNNGFPLRPHDNECSYYMRTGQCKFGWRCKFHHPEFDGVLVTPGIYSPFQSSYVPSPHPYALTSWQMGRPPGVPGSPMYDIWHPGSTAFAYGGPYMPYSSSTIQSSNNQQEHGFPERPGQRECQYYMRTGDCKFGILCKFDHPRNWSSPKSNNMSSPYLPLRPGAQPCLYYAKNGYCKDGHACKYDHPVELSKPAGSILPKGISSPDTVMRARPNTTTDGSSSLGGGRRFF